MTIRIGHGHSAEKPAVVEVSPADELPRGIPSPSGRIRKHRVTAAFVLKTSEDPEFGPYVTRAEEFRVAHTAAIARNCGAGMCGPGPSSIVATASWQWALSQ